MASAFKLVSCWLPAFGALLACVLAPARSQAEADPDLEPLKEDRRPRAPPPPAPDPNAQLPRPFLPDRERPKPEERVEVGADVGVWHQPAESSSVEYGPGVGYGIHARLELIEWLALRPFFQLIARPVTLEPGALGPSDVSFEQDSLRTLLLGGKVEPTLVLGSRVRAWLGLGVAWGRTVAPEPVATGGAALFSLPIRSAERTGVFLEYSAGLGARFEAIPSRLGISLSASFGLVGGESGGLYTKVQAFDEDGHRLHLSGLPKLERSASALLGVGWIL